MFSPNPSNDIHLPILHLQILKPLLTSGNRCVPQRKTSEEFIQHLGQLSLKELMHMPDCVRLCVCVFELLIPFHYVCS